MKVRICRRVVFGAICMACASLLDTALAAGQTADWIAAAEEGLAMHRDAERYEEGRAALDHLVATCHAYPSEPMPCFWAAYVATQTVGYNDVPDRDSAREMIDIAWSRYSEAIERGRDEPAAFLALRSLIAKADGWSASAEDKDEREQLSLALLRRAIMNDPRDPVVRTAAAVEVLIESSVDRIESIALALDVLRGVKVEMDSTSGTRAITPWFNEEWLPFWIGRAESLLDGALQIER